MALKNAKHLLANKLDVAKKGILLQNPTSG